MTQFAACWRSMSSNAPIRSAVHLLGARWCDRMCGLLFGSTPHHLVAASSIPMQMASLGTGLCSGKVEFWQTKLHGPRLGSSPRARP
jgi:hypothetical protein